ncbi:hypothetical protein CP980_34855 [Streptomyces vinaceus]|uniref:Uncharacterized protein n=1 Tax=Streptomyces vinaceus TaxID=1960 RepID=A0A5J6JEY5_STRVI|nr:hypothetical protein CP980_34855 [Streptomyces vinaceus]
MVGVVRGRGPRSRRPQHLAAEVGDGRFLVAGPALIALLAAAPSVPARRNPVPGRRSRATHRAAAAHSAR